MDVMDAIHRRRLVRDYAGGKPRSGTPVVPRKEASISWIG
jgi:hypothetical protein